jgi:hypothetical protein
LEVREFEEVDFAEGKCVEPVDPTVMAEAMLV